MAWPKIVLIREMKVLEKDIDLLLAGLAEDRSSFFFMRLTGRMLVQ
ncbi:hypothetical protein [Peribacillus simplex]